MTKEELAAMLNGREYGAEITKAEEAIAKAAGLVVIFGYSDDNVELRGSINDEVGMYDGGRLCITSEGAMPSWESIDHSDQDEAREYFRKEALPQIAIDCEFSPAGEDLTWRYSTDAPHATFEVKEDGEVYCRGIVLESAALTPKTEAIAAMTDDQRIALWRGYCRHCGRNDPGCQCWNDE